MKDWTVGMRTGEVGEWLEFGHEDCRVGRRIGLWE